MSETNGQAANSKRPKKLQITWQNARGSGAKGVGNIKKRSEDKI